MRRPKLTIGMATYDDFDGVYFSIQAIRLYHPEVLNECEFLVVDNHPGSKSAELIQKLAQKVPLRYLAFDELSGTAVKDIVIREARGQYVLAMDCHVLFPPGTLKRLLQFFDQHPDTRDLLQGPLLCDDLRQSATHWHLEWFNGGLGTFVHDARVENVDGAPFEIPAHKEWACSRAAVRRGRATTRNSRVLPRRNCTFMKNSGGPAASACACPFLRWIHRLGRPATPYLYSDLNRFRNLMIAHEELTWDFRLAPAHWAGLIGRNRRSRIARSSGERIADSGSL